MTTFDVIAGREVLLGGYRAMTVRRTLPHRRRTSVGPFIFADHFGPAEPAMDVAPHPHTHLATCSWLFSGRVRHDDSAGNHLDVVPGDVVLMAAGDGIAHSEYSWPDGPELHGVQLWVGYPSDERGDVRGLHVHRTRQVVRGGAALRVLLGDLGEWGASPVPAPRRAVAAEVVLDPGATLELDLGREVAVLVGSGSAVLAAAGGAGDQAVVRDDGTRSGGDAGAGGAGGPDGARDGSSGAGAGAFGPDVPAPGPSAAAGPGEMAFSGGVVERARVTAGGDGALLMLLAGDPYGEDLLMFWNFVDADEESVRRAREDWEDEDRRAERYGVVEGYPGFEGEPTRTQLDRIPAPPMPGVRLTARRNP
ncbi:pirin family protein [Corynebacterium sp. 335C]